MRLHLVYRRCCVCAEHLWPVPSIVALQGLAMSGFEQLEPREELIAFFNSQPTAAAKKYRIMNDSEGSIFTASPVGGLVIIAGTGSIAQRISATGQSSRCGGMGHMFSDGMCTFPSLARLLLLLATFRPGCLSW